MKLSRSNVQALLCTHEGNKHLDRTLCDIEKSPELLRVLGRYIQFNSVFGSGVAHLAGTIAARQDLFRDPSEQAFLLADRSTEVASKVFFAAIDEFDDRATRHLDTHRTLAQAMLKGMAEYFLGDPRELNNMVRLNRPTTTAMARVQCEYGVGRMLSEEELFRAIGFHMGSELIADGEFNILSTYLSSNWPELVAHLKSTKVELCGNRHDAYYWIHIHTSVEADHFDKAADAANTAMKFYAGELEQAQEWILNGLDKFSRVQTAFMLDLGKVS